MIAPEEKGPAPAFDIFSVLVLTYRRPTLLRACLKSLVAADLRPVKEIIVAVNGEDYEGAQMARSFSTQIPQLKIVQFERQSRGAARNAAIALAHAEWIYFLDDDIEAPREMFLNASALIAQHADAWAVGGPNLTPLASSFFERVSGHVLESWIGAGPMKQRYVAQSGAQWAEETSFALCNLCVKAASFKDLELSFDPHLTSAEENLFIARLENLGHKALYAPQLAVHHRRRSSLASLLFQVYESGVGRRQVMRKFPQSARIVFFFPAVLILYAVFLAILRPARSFWVAPTLYALITAGEALRCGLKNRNLAASFFFFLLVPLCHIAYGSGFLLGRPFRKSYRMT